MSATWDAIVYGMFNFGYRKFIVLFIARAGSTYLTELLNSHPNILMQGERLVGLNKITGVYPAEHHSQAKYTSKYFRKIRRPSINAVGFKTKHTDITNLDQYGQLLKAMDVSTIHLSRENTVKRVVSWFRGENLNKVLGEWNIHKEEQRTPRIHIPCGLLLERLESVERWDLELREFIYSNQFRVLEISYEELLRSKDSTVNSVCDFLEISRISTDAAVMKNTSDNLEEAIANYDEVIRALSNTKWSNYI